MDDNEVTDAYIGDYTIWNMKICTYDAISLISFFQKTLKAIFISPRFFSIINSFLIFILIYVVVRFVRVLIHFLL